MATAKQIIYSPPLTLLPKRKGTTTTTHTPNITPDNGAPTLTVTIPFTFSTRLARLDARRLQSAASIRRSRTTPRTTSLPRLAQPSARPSVTTTSTTTNSGSVAKRTSSACEASLKSGAEEVEVVVNADQHEVLSPEEEKERRRNEEKCQKWLQELPDRFSSMHVVQHVVYNGNRG